MCLQSDLNNCYNNISMRLLHTERHILLGRCAAGGWSGVEWSHLLVSYCPLPLSSQSVSSSHHLLSPLPPTTPHLPSPHNIQSKGCIITVALNVLPRNLIPNGFEKNPNDIRNFKRCVFITYRQSPNPLNLICATKSNILAFIV